MNKKIYKFRRRCFLFYLTLMVLFLQNLHFSSYATDGSSDETALDYNANIDNIGNVILSSFEQYEAAFTPNYSDNAFNGKVTYDNSYSIYGQFHISEAIAEARRGDLRQHYKEYFSKEGEYGTKNINGYEVLTLITSNADFGSNYYIWNHRHVVLTMSLGVGHSFNEDSLKKYMALIHPLIDSGAEESPLMEVVKAIHFFYNNHNVSYKQDQNMVSGSIYLDQGLASMDILIQPKYTEEQASQYAQSIHTKTYSSEGYELGELVAEGITFYTAMDDKESHWDSALGSYKEYFISCRFHPSVSLDAGEIQNFIETIKPILDGEKAPSDNNQEGDNDASNSISIEKENGYKGLVADGINYLELIIKVPEGSKGTLKISQPILGEITNISNKVVKSLPIEGSDITLHYYPPNYIEDKFLTEKIEAPPHIGSSSTTNIWCAPIELEFQYESSQNSKPQMITLPLKVLRPSVILLHGFTGDKSTWEKLDTIMHQKKFDTVREEYYVNDESGQSIPAQASALHVHVTGVQKSFDEMGIKSGKLDLVGHSMGGLISRQYISKTPNLYAGGVRKLIMVGTPNHGCSYFDSWVGWLQSTFSFSHHEAGKQLYGKNPLILALNQGEVLGKHLDKEVQYGILYGKGMGAYAEGDMVVPELSAKLQGVTAIGYQDRVHSGTFSRYGSSITNDQEIFNQIFTWLQEDIPPGDYNDIKISVYDWEGDSIYLSDPDGGDEIIHIEDDRAGEIFCFQEIETIEDSRIGLKLTSNKETFGFVDISENTKLNFTYVSPDRVEVFIEYGSARFITKSGKEHHFTVVVNDGGVVKTVVGLGTDFVVAATNQGINVQMLEGRAKLIRSLDLEKRIEVIASENETFLMGSNPEINEGILLEPWWENDFYQNKPADSIFNGALVFLTRIKVFLGKYLPPIPESDSPDFIKIVAVYAVVLIIILIIIIKIIIALIKFLLRLIKKKRVGGV